MHTELVTSVPLLLLHLQAAFAFPSAFSAVSQNAPRDVSQSSPFQRRNIDDAARYFNKKLSSRAVVKTTTTQHGNTIDWIPIESQGEIATPPSFAPESVAKPAPVLPELDGGFITPISELEHPDAEQGPPGTVPILRQDLTLLDPYRVSKSGPPIGNSIGHKRASQPHWYASSGQVVDNHGGSGLFSLFHPFVQSSSDFSLIQTAISRQNVPIRGSSNTTMQTLEAGWINWPSQVAQPHLFTYFTTNGYASEGDSIGGWNTEVKGWVQTDDTYFPGTVFPNISTIDGQQYEIKIQYNLYQGNWWLYVKDRYIGYYPASLYSANSDDASATLADHSAYISFYGEIAQAESDLTTTDMGSGEFAGSGWGKSGYIRGLTYTDTNGNAHNYDGSGNILVSDSTRYDLEQHFNSGTNFGSYIYVGGPGAGQNIGG